MHVWVVPLDDPDKKRRRELAHLAEGILLASYLGVTPAMLAFERGPSGKPRLRDQPLQFNISHSGPWALLAVAHAPVGVDVQGPHPNADKPWFAKRVCTPREFEHFGGAPSAGDLLRLWVRKEALIKARGEGSYVAAGEIEALEDHLEGVWLCHDLELTDAPGFHAAVVTADQPAVTVTLRDFSWD